MKLRGLVPDFYIYVSVSNFIYCIPTIGPQTQYSKIVGDRSWEFMNSSQIHDWRNWELGRTVSFLEIFVSNFRYSVQCNPNHSPDPLVNPHQGSWHAGVRASLSSHLHPPCVPQHLASPQGKDPPTLHQKYGYDINLLEKVWLIDWLGQSAPPWWAGNG